MSTRVSPRSSGWIEAAADATPSAFVAMITRSQVPGSDASVVASSRTVRSPLAPSTRSPAARMASMCFLPRVDCPDLVSGRGKETSVYRAHCTGADYCDLHRSLLVENALIEAGGDVQNPGRRRFVIHSSLEHAAHRKRTEHEPSPANSARHSSPGANVVLAERAGDEPLPGFEMPSVFSENVGQGGDGDKMIVDDVASDDVGPHLAVARTS